MAQKVQHRRLSLSDLADAESAAQAHDEAQACEQAFAFAAVEAAEEQARAADAAMEADAPESAEAAEAAGAVAQAAAVAEWCDAQRENEAEVAAEIAQADVRASIETVDFVTLDAAIGAAERIAEEPDLQQDFMQLAEEELRSICVRTYVGHPTEAEIEEDVAEWRQRLHAIGEAELRRRAQASAEAAEWRRVQEEADREARDWSILLSRSDDQALARLNSLVVAEMSRRGMMARWQL